METQGERIKKIRLQLNLQQDKFGEGIGVTKQCISNIERDIGFLSSDKLTNLLLNYNVNINYLLAGIGEMFLNPYQLDEVKLKNKIQEVVLKMKQKGMLK